MIRSLSKDYFQKSRVFLYPALGIKRGVPNTPIETYVSWDGVYAPGDMKLCCLYHLKNDDDFKNFEKSKLLGNKLFNDFKFVITDFYPIFCHQTTKIINIFKIPN